MVTSKYREKNRPAASLQPRTPQGKLKGLLPRPIAVGEEAAKKPHPAVMASIFTPLPP